MFNVDRVFVKSLNIASQFWAALCE